MPHALRLAALGLCTIACVRGPEPAEPEEPVAAKPSTGEAHWRYRASVDAELTRMRLGLCIEGPTPPALFAAEGALEFVIDARVRGGDELERGDDRLLVTTLGEQGCLDLELDLAAMANRGERDASWIGESIMLTPTLWLWHPRLPDSLDATLEFDLPAGVHWTGPWPIEGSSRRLDASAFVWSAWTVLGRFEPLVFDAAGCSFEVAVVGGRPSASAEGLRRWISTAAESSAQLFGRFSRTRASVVAIVGNGWGSAPVQFGMARRGGGASAMLILDPSAEDDALIGEWVSTHEFLHFGMPLVDEAWMSEGFVTYYTTVLRARQGVLASGRERSPFEPEQQARVALEMLADGFDRGSSGLRSLERSSEFMRQQGSYQRVYWGGAALAMDLDVQLRRASAGKRSLDDLMRSMIELLPQTRRWTAVELFERFDREVAGWREAGDLDRDVTPSAIAREHLESRSIPERVLGLHDLAVEIDEGEVRLLAEPADRAALRRSLFAPHSSASPDFTL
ncbi:hypothetical protein ACNOYE_20280 [Nannocystaceae bacterium ST9]